MVKNYEEPMHIHVLKAEKSCKFIFIDEEKVSIMLSTQKKMRSKDIREVKEIIFENFSYITESWKKFHQGK